MLTWKQYAAFLGIAPSTLHLLRLKGRTKRDLTTAKILAKLQERP